MNKVPPNNLQQAHQDNTSISIQEKRFIQGESQRDNTIMGATSTRSSPFSSNLSSLNDEAITRLATNPPTALSTVHSFQQQNNTNIVKHARQNDDIETKKRSIPLESNEIDVRGKKKPCYGNPGIPNTDSTNIPFLDGLRSNNRNFAQEFLDSDTSSSSSEEEAESPAEIVGMHEKIDGDTHISTAATAAPAFGAIDIDLDKSAKCIMPQDPLVKPHGIKEEEIHKTRPDLQYLKKGYTHMPIPILMPSQCSSNKSAIIASPNLPSPMDGKIDDCTTSISLGQKPIHPVVMQVVSSANALSPPHTTLVPKRARGGGSKQSLSDQATGRWTRQEHEAFLVGLKEYGREWKKVAYKIPTRSSAQIRSHAQKYFAKITRDEQQHAAALVASSQLTGLSPIPGDDTGIDHAVGRSSDHLPNSLSVLMLERFNKILKDPETVQRQVEETLCRLRNRYSELQRTIEQKQRRAVEQRVGSSSNRNITTTTHSIAHPSSNLHRSSPLSSQPMTLPLEKTEEHRVVESEDDVRRYIDSSEGTLARKELIALHVLGDTLHRSPSQENILSNSTGRRAPLTCNGTTEASVAGSGTSLELSENRSLGSQQTNDATTSVREKNINSHNQSN